MILPRECLPVNNSQSLLIFSGSGFLSVPRVQLPRISPLKAKSGLSSLLRWPSEGKGVGTEALQYDEEEKEEQEEEEEEEEEEVVEEEDEENKKREKEGEGEAKEIKGNGLWSLAL
ncbi:hypothetical protein H920_08239 [Fukomys damarensis]|uniref:Uncharacterized protein n=1 Tax=Fukomys damarensis TaxID=885580 RepID=A0A091DJ69_FUKDA|nr:hypothetical protein H920_08239 [Fukomys damarensis]